MRLHPTSHQLMTFVNWSSCTTYMSSIFLGSLMPCLLSRMATLSPPSKKIPRGLRPKSVPLWCHENDPFPCCSLPSLNSSLRARRRSCSSNPYLTPKRREIPMYREQPCIQFRLDWREGGGPFHTVTRDLPRTGVWLGGRSLAWNSPVMVRVVLGISTVVECCTSIWAQGPGCSPQHCRNTTECRDAWWFGGLIYQV